MRINNIKYLVISLACILIAACTEVDICESELHPHIAKINVDYNWNNGITVEDSMIVFTYRIVNSWRSGFILDAETGLGRLLYDSADSIYKLDTVKNDRSSFYTKCGEICFTTFNYATSNKNLSVPNVKQTVSSAAIRYKKVYSIEELATIEPALTGWKQYNTYTDKYVPAISDDVYYQTIMNAKIEEGAINNVEFSPSGVLQDIELNLNIKSEGVNIEKVLAEVSGISAAFSLFQSSPIRSTTYKTLFELQNAGTSLYKGNMKVLGLVRSNSFTSLQGDGVLQVAIHTDNGKIYYAQMNMFNAIDAYGEVISGGFNKVVLNIDAPLIVTATTIERQATDMFTDTWVVK